MKNRLVAAFLFCACSLSVNAQLILQNNAGLSHTNQVLGQSFTAPSSVNVTQISVFPKTNFTGTLYVYNGANGSGTAGSVGNPIYTQVGVTLVAANAFQAVTLTSALPITAGNSYTFQLANNSGSFQLGAAPNFYGQGSVVFDYASPIPTDDLGFRIFAGAAPVTAASTASIPTLSEWGLILTSAMVGLFGFAWLRRRH